jgi:hypothetical protein
MHRGCDGSRLEQTAWDIPVGKKPASSARQLSKEESPRGGTGLRYSFDVASHGKTIEVGVDAVTAKVLENGAEDPTKEA